MNKRIIIQIVSILFTAALAGAVLFYTDFSSEYSAMLITFGLIIAGYLVYTAVRKKKIAVREDELSRNVYLKSIKNSWVGAYMSISVISLLHFFNVIFFTMEMLIFYQLVCMNLIFFISLIFYNKHPEAL